MEYQPLRSTEPPEERTKQQNSRDPFYILKERMQVEVSSLRQEFDAWKDLLANTNTSRNQEFRQTNLRVKKSLKGLRTYCADMNKAISIVGKNRRRFTSIDDAELLSRKLFLNDVKALIADVDSTFSSQRTKGKLARDARSELMGKKSGGDEFVESTQLKVAELREKEDLILTDMTSALERLGGVAGDIKSEIDDQGKIIGDMSDGADTALGRLESSIGKMDKLMGKSNKGKYTCIFVLVCIVILEICLIMYT